MIGELFAQRGDLLSRDRTRTVAPLAALVRENVSNFLVGQCLVPRLHHRRAKFLTFDGDWTLQTFHNDLRRPARPARCKLRASERRILTRHAEPVGLMAGLTIRRENLFAAIMR